MKLELKHLAPYLPYGLKYINYSSIRMGLGKPLIGDINTMNVMGFIEEDTLSKPILRPLSDTNKEIEFNGEKVTPSVKLQLTVKEVLLLKAWGDLSGRLSYHQATILFSLHFDLFGLIDNGKAVDINTL